MNLANPVIPGFYPDPSVCRRGRDFFLVTSSFEYFPGVPLFHSTDLVNWHRVGNVLDRASQLRLNGIPSSGGIFAPTIRHHDGTFYVITTCVGGSGHFYVTTRDPFGPWSEPVPVAGPGFDPDLFFDEDGRVFFSREDIHGHGIRQHEIDIATGRLLGDERLIWAGFEDPLCEAPHIYKIGDWYYLLVAEGGTYRGHMVVVARGPSPAGPFDPCPRNPILTHRHLVLDPVQSLGHADLIRAPDGSWWLVFLGTRPIGRWHHLGRETFLAPVTWDDEGWPVVNAGRPITVDGVPAPSFCAGQRATHHQHFRFDAPTWPPELAFRRNPEPDKYDLRAGEGRLVMLGPTSDNPDGFSFVGQRQTDFACRATVRCAFAPAATGEYAGLMAIMNERHYYALGPTLRDGAPGLCLRRRLGSLVAEEFVALERPGEELVLRIDADHRTYAFSYQAGGDRAFQPVGGGECRYLSSEVAGGFTGVFLGPFNAAVGSTSPAVFRDFRYDPVPA